MVRFTHTADWQLGLRVHYIHGDAGANVREARLQTIRTIGQVAEQQRVDFVFVAGDVFEHHGLRPETLRQTFDALSGYPCPVFLLPGNHDPLTPDSLYLDPIWKAEAPDNLRILSNTDPIEASQDVWLLPCPLLERHTLDDTTEHITPEFGPSGVIRIGVAHGGIREILEQMQGGEDYELTNAIRRDAATLGQLDYLGLGDWHSPLQVDERTWYSGAPEATRFKERNPGYVLMVEISHPKAVPSVEKINVCTHRWVQHQVSINAPEDLVPLTQWLDDQPDRHNTLVELFLEGTIDATTAANLDEILAQKGDRFRWLRRRDERLAVFLRDEDLNEIAQDGWVKQVIDDLRAKEATEEDAKGALRLLYRLHRETQT